MSDKFQSRPATDLLGARLRRLRKERGLTLRQVASFIGVSVPAVCRWEKGETTPREVYIRPLADALQVSTSDLFADVQDERPIPDMASPAGATVVGMHGNTADTLAARSLARIVSESKERIAMVAGTSPDRITIHIQV